MQCQSNQKTHGEALCWSRIWTHRCSWWRLRHRLLISGLLWTLWWASYTACRLKSLWHCFPLDAHTNKHKFSVCPPNKYNSNRKMNWIPQIIWNSIEILVNFTKKSMANTSYQSDAIYIRTQILFCLKLKWHRLFRSPWSWLAWGGWCRVYVWIFGIAWNWSDD